MLDNCFVDSNVLLYSLDRDSEKQKIAFEVWKQGVVLSTQVIMEFTNVCVKKLKFTKQDAFKNALLLMEGAIVRSITEKSIRMAFDISNKYQFSHWDSLIIASALESGCKTLYTEDFQHGQIIDRKLKIVNPFISSL
jgi:predicted nucleic acid-binding protein